MITTYSQYISWVSILVGLLTGITCTVYFWGLRGRHGPVVEVASFFCFAMLAYYASDSVGGSGIVSIMVAGILMDVYVRGSHLTEGDTDREFRGAYAPAGQGPGAGVGPRSGSARTQKRGTCRISVAINLSMSIIYRLPCDDLRCWTYF